MGPTRRALLAAPALLPALARAQAFPERPLRLVIPFAPGGSTDMLGRLLAQFMGPRLGQTVVVENRAGAGGSLGAAEVAHARPDGHTLLLCSNGSLVINPLIQANLPYDPFRQLQAVGLSMVVPLLVVVRADHPARTIEEFVAQAKAANGRVSMGSAGTGSSNHLGIELFNAASGAGVTHVPYRGTAPMIPDLLAGNVGSMCDQITTTLPLLRDGKARALAIMAPRRSPLLPAVPTLAESGIHDAEMSTYMGLSVTAPVAPAALAKLAAAMQESLKEPLMSERLESLGAELARGPETTPEGFTRFIRQDYQRMTRAVELANLKPG